MDLAPDFKEFIELLNSHGVKYLVVGGFAVAHHGYPRPTGDIDFFVEATPENSAKLIKVLSDFGFGNLGLSREDFTKPDHIIQLGYPPVRIDLATSLSGVPFQEAWSERSMGEIDDLAIPFLSKRMLISNKAEVGRQKDKADLERLTKKRS